MSSERQTEKLSVNLDVETKRALQKLARRLSHETDCDVTLTALVSEAIAEYLRSRIPTLRKVADPPSKYET